MQYELDFKDIDEFKKQILDVADQFPKTSEKHLRRMGNKFKEELKNESPSGTQKKNDKKKLKNSYRTEIKGYKGSDLEVDICSTARHFHLVNDGHVMKTPGGRVVGFVQGKHFLEKTIQKTDSGLIEDEVEKFYKDISKKLGD